MTYNPQTDRVIYILYFLYAVTETYTYTIYIKTYKKEREKYTLKKYLLKIILRSDHGDFPSLCCVLLCFPLLCDKVLHNWFLIWTIHAGPQSSLCSWCVRSLCAHVLFFMSCWLIAWIELKTKPNFERPLCENWTIIYPGDGCNNPLFEMYNFTYHNVLTPELREHSHSRKYKHQLFSREI